MSLEWHTYPKRQRRGYWAPLPSEAFGLDRIAILAVRAGWLVFLLHGGHKDRRRRIGNAHGALRTAKLAAEQWLDQYLAAIDDPESYIDDEPSGGPP